MINNEELGRRLQTLRKEKGITQEEIATHLGLTPFHISDIERGKHKVSANIIVGYCELIGLTPNEILGFPNELGGIMPELISALSRKNTDEQKQILRLIEAL